ncbi:ribulose-phosphate 3-epimerase [Candidatus Avoscillospira sp. LCP25S3_F1]|uniref:ribulose-phosphate 3-epimerase n=1 Tax=Candidatus Avoscillospira sp. LCP25S3_F1 TaxID=3438825 RepID=UPI003F91B198
MQCKVAPSILSANFNRLGQDIARCRETGADYLHFDVMDGIFVPNISFGLPVLESVRKETDMVLDVHLMIDRPVRYVERFCQAGADIVTVHVEADTEENTRKALEQIRGCGKRAAVSVKPKTPAEAVLPFLKLCSMVLVMTVEPGFGGQSFMADMMPKVTAIRRYITEAGLECEVEVDGGVALDTAKLCADAGANVLVAGSAFFKAAEPAAFVEALHGLAVRT